MAKHADPSIPDSLEEWLDEFSTSSIYQVLPKIIELWGLNVQTDVESKKTSHNRSADDSTLVSASLRTARHLHPGSWLTHNRDGERYVRRKQQWWVQGLCTDRYTEGFRFILTENSQLIEWHYIDVTRVCEYTVNHVEILRMSATNLKSESADGKSTLCRCGIYISPFHIFLWNKKWSQIEWKHKQTRSQSKTFRS